MNLAQAIDIISRVSFKDWVFWLDETQLGSLYLQVRYLEADVDGDPNLIEIQHGRKWYISRHCTPSELVQTAFKAVATSMEHQAREHFLYRGARVYGPHFDVEQLVALCRTPEATEERP